MIGSLTGAVGSQKITELLKGGFKYKMLYLESVIAKFAWLQDWRIKQVRK